MRKLNFGKHGLRENPVGLTVTWGERGNEMGHVTGFYLQFNKARGDHSLMLETRFFCGDRGPDVNARSVSVLEEAPGCAWCHHPITGPAETGADGVKQYHAGACWHAATHEGE